MTNERSYLRTADQEDPDSNINNDQAISASRDSASDASDNASDSANASRSASPSYSYTLDDLKHLVQYASDRGISVIPEIDMPAHTL